MMAMFLSALRRRRSNLAWADPIDVAANYLRNNFVERLVDHLL
jgi:hypothetical protein